MATPTKSVLDIKPRKPEEVLGGLQASNANESAAAGENLIREAADYGLNLHDYLTLAINPRMSEQPRRYEGLTGYESALAFLQLPFRNDFSEGIILQAASESFQRFPGTRAMFPEVIDEMLRWKNRQDTIETVAPLVSQSRTIAGVEMISTVVDDDSKDRGTFTVSEGGRIPVRTLRTSQTSIGMFKHGSGIELTYEFQRRASLDVLTPYAARIARELEISKVAAATDVLLNGDTVNPAATAANITTYGGVAVDGSNPLSGQYKAICKWLMARAKAGVPIDTIVGNFDIFVELLFMFTPTLQAQSLMEALTQKAGTPKINLNLPILNGTANFVLSSTMPANKLLGYSKADTLEELVEAGSAISESEKAIRSQKITYVKSEVTGYRIAYGDTRSLLNVAA